MTISAPSAAPSGATSGPSPLSQRIVLLQQTLPFGLLVLVMIYELTRHLLFQEAAHPSLLTIELLMFGITGPAALWLTLHWIRQEVRARETAQGEADTRMRLLMEMHHRIKNNLQTVADLLTLEMAQADARPPLECLRDSVARIKSIAAAHELLSLEWVGAVELTELTRRVAESARNAMARTDRPVAVRVDGAPIYVPSKTATSFALVINELVSNALEHGLAGGGGAIDIALDRDEERVQVLVRDDGSGLPPGFDLRAGAGLGLQIVRNLVEKDMRGAIQMYDDDGTAVEFNFPVVTEPALT